MKLLPYILLIHSPTGQLVFSKHPIRMRLRQLRPAGRPSASCKLQAVTWPSSRPGLAHSIERPHSANVLAIFPFFALAAWHDGALDVNVVLGRDALEMLDIGPNVQFFISAL